MNEQILQALANFVATVDKYKLETDEARNILHQQELARYDAYVVKLNDPNYNGKDKGNPLPFQPVLSPITNLYDLAKQLELPSPSDDLKRSDPWK